MFVWIKRGCLSLAVLGLLFTGAAQAQNGLSVAAGAAAVFDACPDPTTDPVDVSTPCLAIVSFDSLVSKDERSVIIRGTGASVRFNFSIVDAAAVLVPNEAAYWALADDPDVTAFTPDRRVEAFAKPERCDPWPECKDGGTEEVTGGGSQDTPSGVARIFAPDVWLDQGITGDGIGVAIVDTGLDLFNADLNVAILCFDAIGGGCGDGNGHGTHVGGIVAALDNTTDVVGVAPGATLYAVRVLNNSGSGSDSTVMAGLQWVLANSASIQVVNMSLGRQGSIDDNAPLRLAVQNLVAADITVVVAAGNDRTKEISDMVPASYPEVMAVASTTAEDGKNKCKRYIGFIEADTASYFTTDGADDPDDEDNLGVAISAPGAQKENISGGCFLQSVGILSLKAGGGTTRMFGTSMASPHVAGVVALMLDAAAACTTALKPDDVRGIIAGSADFGGDNLTAENSILPIDSPVSGYTYDDAREGIVDAPWAVNAAEAVTCSP